MNQPTGRFQIGARVRERRSSRYGTIIETLPADQIRVVFDSGSTAIVRGIELEMATPPAGFVSQQQFLADLVSFKLSQPLSDTLYSYQSSRTHFEAYQFKPAIKLLSNADPVLLIADEVGLGKTIEAAIIYLELKARMRDSLRRVLVVCPASLQEKQRTELRQRFGEEFQILDAQGLRRLLDDYECQGTTLRFNAIASVQMMRSSWIVERIVELGMWFDLVIADEAHHMRNPETLTFDLGQALSARSDAMLLLTATPVQLRELDLFYLLNILSPGSFPSPELFEFQVDPNRYLNRAISALTKSPPDLEGASRHLQRAPEPLRSNPVALQIRDQLATNRLSENPGRGNGEQLVSVIRDLHSLNTLGTVLTRTRRRDAISDFATRTARVLRIDLSPVEKEIYETALEFSRVRMEHLSGSASALGLVQIERQIASSLGAFREIVQERTRGIHVPIEEEDSSGSTQDIDLSGASAHLAEVAAALRSAYERLGNQDSKFDTFVEAIKTIFATRPNTKLIIFSFFRKTLDYLARRMNGHGYQVEVIHGGKDVLERQSIIDRFREDPERKLLLSSEVGSEGLDFQFCDTIVNYDLPWNPMRVEQRIGRIDRYGQQSPRVTIVSLILNDTIETRILARLYERIRIFEESIGGLEPILGDVTRELSQEIISQRLTPEEETQRAEQVIRTIEQRRQDLEQFENNRLELMGQDAFFQKEVEARIDSGRFVSANELKALLLECLSRSFPRTRFEPVDKRRDIWRFVPDREYVDAMNAFIVRDRAGAQALNKDFSQRIGALYEPRGRLWSAVRGRTIPVTMSSQTSLERGRTLEFVNIWHPMVKMAFNSRVEMGSPPLSRMGLLELATVEGLPDGLYPFFLFYLEVQAFHKSQRLLPIVLNPDGSTNEELATSLLPLIQSTDPESTDPQSVLLPEVEKVNSAFPIAIEMMAAITENVKADAKLRNDSLIAARQAALGRTYRAKISRLEQRLQHAQDARIIRMYQGEVRNLEIRLAGELEEVERMADVSLQYSEVAYGLIRIGATNLRSATSTP